MKLAVVVCLAVVFASVASMPGFKTGINAEREQACARVKLQVRHFSDYFDQVCQCL